MKKILIIALGIFMLTGCAQAYTTIDANRTKALLENGAIIIDVRTTEEYNESHIENAINIPLDKIDTIDYGKEEKIIVYCASGVRSMEAAKTLTSLGYTNIYNLDGGLINWGFEE